MCIKNEKKPPALLQFFSYFLKDVYSFNKIVYSAEDDCRVKLLTNNGFFQFFYKGRKLFSKKPSF